MNQTRGKGILVSTERLIKKWIDHHTQNSCHAVTLNGRNISFDPIIFVMGNEKYLMKPEARIYDFVLVYTGNELLKSDSGSKWEMSWPKKFWQQRLLEDINDYQKLFKAARAKIGFDSEVTEAYEDALDSINKTVTAVHYFAAVFNRVYRPKD